MRYPIGVLTLALLSACAGAPPKPPAGSGEYRPVNRFDPHEAGRTATASPSTASR